MLLTKFFRTTRSCLWLLIFAGLGQTSLFAQQGPPLRTGLWVTERVSENAEKLNAFEAAVRANPNLTGICLNVGWKDLEKQAGKPDFSAIDKTVAMLRRINKKYELGVKPGVDTPRFVFQEGAKSIETTVSNPNRANAGEPVMVPVPWDPTYQRHFSTLIEQLGERYASDPLCTSVVLTCANFMSKEMHLPKRGEDLAKWKAMGNYEAKLLDVYKKYTDEWAKAFPRQAISLHLSQVLDLSSTFFEQIIDYGLAKYPERFTIQNCQLTGKKEDIGVMSYNLVQQYRDRAHHGFQSLAAFSHGGERMGSIEMAVLNVVHAKGEYWELWRGDGLSVEASAAVLKAWEEANRLGYEGYKNKLISEGSYRQGGGRHRADKVKRRGKRAASAEL